VLIRNVLDGLHGVDKNPFAVSIARFRLLIAAMKAGGVKQFADAPAFPLNIAVGDSLLHGRGAPGQQRVFDGMDPVHTFGAEDVGDYIKSADILGVNSYHVVVGNPPYITVKDSAENQAYRDRYATCAGTYALSVPFAERFFNLACRAGGDRRGAGYVGQITANSFMKREFGKKLIQDFFAQKIDLTHVIDSSGSYIPGHGTPTVILAGRNMIPTGHSIRAALGVRGEPSQPEEPAKGHVWRAIVDQINEPGSDSEWITVTDLTHKRISAHPLSLSGGGAQGLVQAVEGNSVQRMMEIIDPPISRSIRAGSDEAFMRPIRRTVGASAHLENLKPIALGEGLRDWRLLCEEMILIPTDQAWTRSSYATNSGLGASSSRNAERSRVLWPMQASSGGSTCNTRPPLTQRRFRSPLLSWQRITILFWIEEGRSSTGPRP
jgi:Eco57I restriction-modification methylase